nr:hypothetical protein Iba_chr14aCG8700 [Ipomoea batatas]
MRRISSTVPAVALLAALLCAAAFQISVAITDGNCSAWNHSERFGTEIFYYAQALNSHPARLRFGEMSSRDHADQSSARDCEAAQTGRGARIFLDGGCRRTEDDRHRGWWKTMEVCSGETVT